MPQRRVDPPAQREAGLGSVELAVVFPVVLFLLTATLHVAMLYLAGHVADDMAATAVETAARYGAERGAGEQQALDVAAQEGFVSDPTVTVARHARTVEVTVTVKSRRLIPGLPDRITRTVQAPLESFTAEASR